MIAKQIKGRSFRQVLSYLNDKVGAQRIGGNMVGKTPAELTVEFACAQQLNPALQRAVYHTSLAVPCEEAQPDQTWRAIAKDYLKGMGFQGCQYAVYRHTDTEHDHIHVVASRTRLTDGTTVSDSWDYKRSEALVRELEKTYKLAEVEPRDKGVRSQTTGEFRQLQRTGEPSIREQLKLILKEASANSPTMPQFVERMLAAGVQIKASPGQNQIRGISYALNGVAFSGTHIGRDYTFPGLQKHRGISYDSARDNEAITRLIEQGLQSSRKDDSATTALLRERLPETRQGAEANQSLIPPINFADTVNEKAIAFPTAKLAAKSVEPSANKLPEIALESPAHSPETEIATEPEWLERKRLEVEHQKPPEIDPLQKRCAEAIAPVAIAFLKLMHQNGELENIGSERWQYQGDRYAMTYDKAKEAFSVEALDGRGELFQLSQAQGVDTIVDAKGIGKIDIDNFHRIEQRLLLQQQVEEEKRQQIEAG